MLAGMDLSGTGTPAVGEGGIATVRAVEDSVFGPSEFAAFWPRFHVFQQAAMTFICNTQQYQMPVILKAVADKQ